MYIGLHVKYPIFFSDFNETEIFSTDFQNTHKTPITSKSIKWQPSCSMQVGGQRDRQTDRHDEANSRFLQICEHA